MITELGCEGLAINVMPDHVPFILCPPRLAPFFIKARALGVFCRGFQGLKARVKYGKLWSRSYFVATVGNVTADIVKMLRSSG